MSKRGTALPTIMRTVAAFREFSLVLVLLVMAVIMTFVSPVFLNTGQHRSHPAGLVGRSDHRGRDGDPADLRRIGSVGRIHPGLHRGGHRPGADLPGSLSSPVAILLGLLAALLVGLANGLAGRQAEDQPLHHHPGHDDHRARADCWCWPQGKAVLNLPKSFTVVGQGQLVRSPVSDLHHAVPGYHRRHPDAQLALLPPDRTTSAATRKQPACRASTSTVVKIFNYCLVALLAGVAGIMITARFGSSSVTVGSGVELRVITATIIGGASLSGGEGSVFGRFSRRSVHGRAGECLESVRRGRLLAEPCHRFDPDHRSRRRRAQRARKNLQR